MSIVTEDERYTRSAAVETNVACCSGVTPRKTSGGFVWYPYSVSQIGFRPKARWTSRSSRSRSAIVMVWQLTHFGPQGVSNWGSPDTDGGRTRRASRGRLPCPGSTPPAPRRRRHPPAARRPAADLDVADRRVQLRVRGLSRVSTYVFAVVGRRNVGRFGSFQIVQYLIHG